MRGRAAEIEVLDALVADAARGRGRILILDGPVGLGKTTLLDYLDRAAHVHGLRVLRAAGDVAAQTVPLGVLLQALAVRDDPPIDAELLRGLSRSADQRFWLLREVEDGLQRAALARPMIVVIDDLQWTDAATLNALASLPAQLAPQPILWAVAVRSGELPASVQRMLARLESVGAVRLTLTSLDRAAVIDVAADYLGGAPDPALLDALDSVEGHPFFLVELLRALLDEGLVAVDGGVARLRSSRIPSGFIGSIDRHLQRMSGETREMLQMAAVLGSRFSVDELAELLQRPISALFGPIREALAARVIVEDEHLLSFSHALVRDAIEAGLPAALVDSLRRQALDIRLAHGSAASDVAPLVLVIARPGDARAVGLLRRAAAEIGVVSPAVALPLSRRALDLTPPGDAARSAIALECVDLLTRAGLAAEAGDLLASTQADLDDHVAEANARLKLAVLNLQYLPTEVEAHSQRALALPGLARALRRQLHSVRACGRDIAGDVPGSFRTLAEADAEAPSEHGDKWFNLPPRALAALARGEWHHSLDLMREAVAARNTVTAPVQDPDTWSALIHIALSRLDDAQRIIDVGIRRAQSEGMPSRLRVWSMLRSRLLLALGRLDDAQAEAEAVLDMSDDIGNGRRGYVNGIAGYVLARVALHTGSSDGQQDALRTGLQLIEVRVCPATQRIGYWLAAMVSTQPDAMTLVDTVGADAIDPYGSGYLQATSPLSYADAVPIVQMLLAGGRTRAATDVVERLEAAVQRSPDYPFLQASAVHCRALLTGDADLALTAAALHDADPRPLVRARVIEDAGRLLPAERQPEAVKYLESALALYADAGAEHDVARVRGLLRTRGVRRAKTTARRAQQWPELTDSEVAVVRLAVVGATNREIAERLYISPYTVNSHLRHIFAKLDIHSRVELATLASQREPTR